MTSVSAPLCLNIRRISMWVLSVQRATAMPGQQAVPSRGLEETDSFAIIPTKPDGMDLPAQLTFSCSLQTSQNHAVTTWRGPSSRRALNSCFIHFTVDPPLGLQGSQAGLVGGLDVTSVLAASCWDQALADAPSRPCRAPPDSRQPTAGSCAHTGSLSLSPEARLGPVPRKRIPGFRHSFFNLASVSLWISSSSQSACITFHWIA
ncbi:uncharacterized protein LOC115274557 [Suricata suricatta]|uniref:uncharacterized protein LOC115274557 n=1 Tax=Suricata suricatta TaxID=37032 RepID=UPI001155E5BB|nr:uncharacterized protein LOC115274557 [Suricata suricatta]